MKKQFLFLIGAFLICFNVNAQSKKLTIKVKDENNKPVPGAIILFDNVRQNRWTNSNGIFKAKIKSTPKEISAFHPSIGISKIKYNGKGNVFIKIKKGKDFSVINSMKTKSLDTNQFSTIYDYLKGQIPGVSIDSDNNITIRGYSTINGNMTPLFVLNNSAVNQDIFGNIVQNQIKSITVIKGPETAIYGIRGANGVIVVETL